MLRENDDDGGDHVRTLEHFQAVGQHGFPAQVREDLVYATHAGAAASGNHDDAELAISPVTRISWHG